MTVEQWLNKHIENLTGVDPNTRTKYRSYVRNELGPMLGELTLAALSAERIALSPSQTRVHGTAPGS